MIEVDLGLIGGNPLVPQLGNTFQVLSAGGGISGKFASADLPMLAAGKMWQIRYSATSVSLAVTLAGDYNDNGAVDASDYTVWRNLMGAAFDPRADGDSNGIVNSADYDIWKTNFGSVAGAGASAPPLAAAVPEPSTAFFVLTVLAIASAFVRHPRC
jgi:hypothetical protein